MFRQLPQNVIECGRIAHMVRSKSVAEMSWERQG